MTCKECYHYELCNALESNGIPRIPARLCDYFEDKSYFIKTPCKIGDTVYKICPICSVNHNGSCQRCAWRGCHPHGCDVGVGICSDGSYNDHKLQVVQVNVRNGNLITIIQNWNTMYFGTYEAANIAISEYDVIRKNPNKTLRISKFNDWYNKRHMSTMFDGKG